MAHAHRSVPELAFVGAKLNLNRLAITDLTVRQSAKLAGVSVPYVAAAVAIIDDPDACEAVLAGNINIIDAAKRSNGRESLAEHIRRSTPAELVAAAQATGVDLIWDGMIDPLI